MARIRSLKIGFFENEELARQPFEARLLFEGLWLLADRDGRLEDRPIRIGARLFPYDLIDVQALLERLNDAGFILRYAADGAAYIQILNFTKHQRPKSDEPVSVIPAPVLEHPRGIVAAPRGSPLGKDRETEDRETGEEDGADGAPIAADGAAPQLFADGATKRRAEDFAELWNSSTTAPIARCRDVTSKRRRQVHARLTERSWDEWREVFERINASAFCRGENDRGWRASFDWVIGSPDVAVKVLEGKYDSRKPQPASRAPTRTAWTPDVCRGRGHGGECLNAFRCQQRLDLDSARAQKAAAS